jgi:hypothetical protein
LEDGVPAHNDVEGLCVTGGGGEGEWGAAEEEGLLEEVNGLGEGSWRDAVGGGGESGCFACVFGCGTGCGVVLGVPPGVVGGGVVGWAEERFVLVEECG